MDTLAWLWLQSGLGYGAQNSGEVLAAYPGGAKDILADVQGLAAKGLVTPGQAAKLANSHPQDFAPVVDRALGMGLQVVSYADVAYPSLLRAIFNPPLVLFVQGRAALLNGRVCVAMIGTRRPSAYGAKAMRSLAAGVAAGGAVVVSGLAAGLDAEAHKAALGANGDTVACIAFGHDACYPAANRNLLEVIGRNGAVISEYPPGVHAEKVYFLQRNRLIAGLSQGLVVAEARRHSGTMSTVAFAQDYGRDVFAVPGDIFSPLSGGTNAMLQEGAFLAAGAEDILSLYDLRPAPESNNLLHDDAQKTVPVVEQTELGGQQETEPFMPNVPRPLAPKPAPDELDGDALLVYRQLGGAPVALGVLCEETGLGPGRVMATLMELELAGFCRQWPGRQFTIL